MDLQIDSLDEHAGADWWGSPSLACLADVVREYARQNVRASGWARVLTMTDTGREELVREVGATDPDNAIAFVRFHLQQLGYETAGQPARVVRA